MKSMWLCLMIFLLGCGSPRVISQIPPSKIPVFSTPTLAPSPMPLGQQGDWELIFRDEFDGDALNTIHWTTCYWWDWNHQGCTISSNNELEWYQSDDVLVRDGMLLLRAQRRSVIDGDGRNYPFTSGMISSGKRRDDASPPGLVFQYGYIECRAKLPAGRGLFSSFWLLPSDYESKPEVDILEVLGNTPNTIFMTIHYQTSEKYDNQVGEYLTGPDFSSEWHVFALDWQPEALVWYVDGVERWRYATRAYIPQEPMYIIANLAVGGDWPGAPDDETVFPSYFSIDYVRVWQQ